MPPTQKIQNDQYRNWVRAVLGLYFLQEGLRDFVDRIVKLQHLKILQNVRKTLNCPTAQCTRCPVATILPAHAGTACVLRRCNCKRRSNKHCPFCSNVYDEIIHQHRYRDPNWETDANKWCTDHWQFARCFLTTTNKNGDNSATGTDAAGLLSIIINAKFFQSEISSVINAPYDDFSQARLTRNETIHCSTLELKDTEVCRYLQMMIIVLEDSKTLLNDPLAKAAAENIKELQNDKLIITTEHESKAIEVVLKALESKKLECLQEIERREEESLESIQSAKDKAVEDLAESNKVVDENKDKIEKLTTDLQNVETRLSVTENAVLAVQTDVSELKEDITEIKERITTLEDLQKQHAERLNYLQRKKYLKTHLIEQYEDYLTSDVSPFLPEEDVHLSKVFVPVKMIRTYRVDPATQGHVKSTTSIDYFHDVVYNDSKLACNVLVCGDAGTGKTTFCKALICKWCEAQSVDKYDERLALHTIIQGDGSKFVREADLETMKTFEFLLYVSLRHTYDERFVEDMICNQLFYPEQNSVLLEIFSVEPEVCLVVLDGLDEWSPAKGTLRPVSNACFPKARFSYAKITTSRPWRLDTVRPNSDDVDIQIKLEGIGKTSADQLTKSTVLELNKKFQARLFFWKFQDEVKRMKLEELCKTPILLKLLVCLWYDEQSLGKSYCGIYSAIINVMIKHANERFKGEQRFQILKSNLSEPTQSLPSCFDGKYACQEMPMLLVSLSRLAFHALFSEDRATSLVFQQDDIKKHGLKEEELELSKKIGLLSVSQVPGRSVINKYQCFSFPHKSLQEFLAAIYISMVFEPATPQNQIMQGFSSFDVLRQNSVVFKFLCGLDHSKAAFLSKHIAGASGKEKKILDHRSSLEGFVNFEGHYNSQCNPLVSEIQDIFYECIMEGKECGHTDMKLHISDLDVDINTKIRTCAQSLDMTSLMTFRIHDERSAVENEFLNGLLAQECGSLTHVVFKNISLTKAQFSRTLSRTVILMMRNIDFYDFSDDEARSVDLPIDSKIKKLTISSVTLRCISFNHLLSYLFTLQSVEWLSLQHVECKSPCVRNFSKAKTHVTVHEPPVLKHLDLENVAVTFSALDFLAAVSFGSKRLQEVRLKDVTCTQRDCTCITLHFNTTLVASNDIFPGPKYISLDSVPIDRESFRNAYQVFRSAESIVLRNLVLYRYQMDELLSHIVDSPRLKRLAICKVNCTSRSSEDDDILDFQFILPTSLLEEFCIFRLSDVHMTHNHLEMIISVLSRASNITHSYVRDVKCASHDEPAEYNCPFNEMIQVLHKKACGLYCQTPKETENTKKTWSTVLHGLDSYYPEFYH